MQHEIEFKKGDVVTFHNYDTSKPIKAKVVEVTSFFDKLAYKLSGINKPLISITSGVSIVESKYFKLAKTSETFKESKK